MEKVLNKSELKSLVKECLVEILLEGIGNKTPRVNENNQKRQIAEAMKPVQSRRPALDMIRNVPVSAQQQQTTRSQQNAATYKDLANGNDVMASIFADTAASGLVEHVGAEQARSNLIIDTGVNPSMFEGAANWATLAFSESKSKKLHS